MDAVESPRKIRYVSAGFIAERHHVSRRTVKSWVDNGRLKPASRTPGGHYRFVHPDDEALVVAETSGIFG